MHDVVLGAFQSAPYTVFGALLSSLFEANVNVSDLDADLKLRDASWLSELTSSCTVRGLSCTVSKRGGEPLPPLLMKQRQFLCRIQ